MHTDDVWLPGETVNKTSSRTTSKTSLDHWIRFFVPILNVFFVYSWHFSRENTYLFVAQIVDRFHGLVHCGQCSVWIVAIGLLLWSALHYARLYHHFHGTLEHGAHGLVLLIVVVWGGWGWTMKITIQDVSTKCNSWSTQWGKQRVSKWNDSPRFQLDSGKRFNSVASVHLFQHGRIGKSNELSRGYFLLWKNRFVWGNDRLWSFQTFRSRASTLMFLLFNVHSVCVCVNPSNPLLYFWIRLLRLLFPLNHFAMFVELIHCPNGRFLWQSKRPSDSLPRSIWNGWFGVGLGPARH